MYSRISLSKALNRAGFTVLGDSRCPIVPVLLGDAKLATQFADALLDRDIYVIGFSYPVVPKGQARIRVSDAVIVVLQSVERLGTTFRGAY